MVIARATLTGMERKKGWLLLVGYSSMPQAYQGYGVLCIKPVRALSRRRKGFFHGQCHRSRNGREDTGSLPSFVSDLALPRTK
jgi:hypothetical protein